MLKNHRPAPLRRRKLQFLNREKNVKTAIDIEKFCDEVGTRNCARIRDQRIAVGYRFAICGDAIH
jgi:hypothetical protein